jgi:tetratricopeptide (TPR) repeat protein
MSRRPGPPPNTAAPPAFAGAGTWPTGWCCALVFLLALLAYLPALTGGFLWDDHGHVTRADLQSWGGLFRIWFEVGATQQYYPLLHSAFWVEHLLWGDATLGYHLVNVLLHATTACLFGTLLRRLAVPGAWLAALLFALHPVCVESVAWISEQKNTLSAVFYLAAALAWLRFAEERSPRRYLLATGLFVLALLTKTVTATLPAALLVLCWWRHGRFEWRRDVRSLLPWFALGIASGLFTAHFERELIGAQGADFTLGVVARGLLAGRIVWFYAAKLLWPANLVFIYPRWTVEASVWWQWLFPLAALALLAGLAWWSRRQRGPLAAALLFGGTLFPVLGFVNVYPFVYSYVADHFQYLASLPVFALAAAGLTQAAARLPQPGRYAAGGVLLVTLGSLSWAQSGMYRDALTLYETTLERNPDCWMAHNNVSMVLVDAGRIEEALPHLQAALKLRPDFPQALSNLGDDLVRLGRPEQALAPIRRALELQPGYPEAHNNLGNALMELGRPAEAMAAFQAALKFRPEYATAYCNLGLALATLDRTPEALVQFEHAARLDPHYADAQLNWAIGLTLLNRFPEAIAHFNQAIEFSPNDVEARNTYGQALARNNRNDEALAQFLEALRLNPNNAEAHLNAGFVLRQLGRTPEANEHFSEARRLNPNVGR